MENPDISISHLVALVRAEVTNVLLHVIELAFVSGKPCLFSHGDMELQKKDWV